MNASAEPRQAAQRNDGENSPSDADAQFLGWQKTVNGDASALYIVTARHHPLYRSTVSERTLRQQNLEIPKTPPAGGNVKGEIHEK